MATFCTPIHSVLVGAHDRTVDQVQGLWWTGRQRLEHG